ncbi:hypothetical protein ACPXCE_09135 [Streptomyces sp. DT24]|uniref:hypothetical protein n=1 Tax=unclassified Streptomyces TaxID=2593676 RepID=UPI0023B9EE4E|nr:hypothetical protein [Streptomyces sp. AM 4-1-1]WEH33605.1 hypothetical protein PZB75_09595 [Streptomyces sp. AM 4-1-1]
MENGLVVGATQRVTGRSRITLFPLDGLTVAYTTRSSDSRGLGDVAIIGVTAPEGATGVHLWRLAAGMYTNPPPAQTQARWLLTQCGRARMVRADDHHDLPDTRWTGELDRAFPLDALFANHTSLRTGRLVLGR